MLLRLIVICVLLSLLCASPVYPQLHGQDKIDSLLKELPRQKEDTNKVKLLNNLSFGYCSINSEEGIIYGQQGLELASKLGSEFLIANASSCLGMNYWYKSDYQKALENYLKAMKIFEKIGSKAGINFIAGNIGNVYGQEGNYPKALEYYFISLKAAEEIGDKGSIAYVNGNIATVYFYESDFPLALEYYMKSLKSNEEIGDKSGTATSTGNIGNVYAKENNYPKALEYYFKALKLHEEEGYKHGIASVSGNIGTVYNLQQNYRQALFWHLKGLQMAEAIGGKFSEAIALCNIGEDYIGIVTHPPDKAKMTIAQEPHATPYHSDLVIPKGRATLLHKAVEYLDKAVVVSKEAGDIDNLQTSYRALSTADSLLGDYKAALNAFMLHTRYRDSVFSKENARKIMQQQMKYKYEKVQDSLALVNAKKDDAAAMKLQRQRSYTFLGVGGVLALAVFSFFMFRNNKLLGNEKERSDELLLNILPSEVARELKEKGTSQARHYDNVTVLFTDFVNFTQASESMGAQNLIDELHTCFKKFDEISEKYNIEKIKTIGDAYLAVAGLPAADPHHAENIVNAAQDIVAFMDDRLAKMGTERTFQVRVGIHSGSVVAGIVGVKKFAYDIWGDTVNTAARMEQNSEAGKINISQTTYELVKDKFACEYRGEVEAKGKGVMKMYYLTTGATS